MLTRKRILILSSSHGSGHKMVASALRDSFESLGHIVSVQDLFDKTSPSINKMLEKSYLLSYSFGSAFYKKMYYDMEESAHGKFVYNLWNFTDKALIKMIEGFQPDCIINTYPYTISSIKKEEYYPNIPVFTVVTDFCIPKAWIHGQTDRYYVACDNVKNILVSEGFSENQILKTGIPIRENFHCHQSKYKIIKKYNLDPRKKTLIIFAGTHGVIKNLKAICSQVSEMKNLQTIVICGKNRNLSRTLALEHYKNIHVLGFIKNIHELYAIGDLMLTKPGGITLSEVIAKKIPTILYNPVPGQENENAQWFKSQGAAIIANTTSEAVIAIKALMDNEIKRHSMKNELQKMYYGRATNLITEDILKNIGASTDVFQAY
ncbi:MAG: MGDG synthase family glycosyltransferase [Eubacteriaceae bacterium]